MKFLARILDDAVQNIYVMIEFRKRYKALKEKAKQLMLRGEMNSYLELLMEIEQMNLILLRIK